MLDCCFIEFHPYLIHKQKPLQLTLEERFIALWQENKMPFLYQMMSNFFPHP